MTGMTKDDWGKLGITGMTRDDWDDWDTRDDWDYWYD